MTRPRRSRTFPLAMADVDPELAERVARWCAEAGRQTAPAEIRRAMAPLGWDDLLAVRALLVDPPPARPLGPFALVDIARGVPPDLAAEREREGRYRGKEAAARSEEEAADREARFGGATPAPPPRPSAGRRRKGTAIVIRRARDRAPAQPAAVAEPPRVGDLRRPEGRAVLERLIRRHGARRAALARALAAGWRRDDGAPPGEEDVASLLEHHGLARAFARRERDELLHALRAAGGFRPAAAERLALDAGGLDAAVTRLGVSAEAERIRDERRAELRGRATLAERVRLLLG
ncbi:MAG TPA: Fis family transcriptional regulator, partial [Anaeromyxobacter sp.]